MNLKKNNIISDEINIKNNLKINDKNKKIIENVSKKLVNNFEIIEINKLLELLKFSNYFQKNINKYYPNSYDHFINKVIPSILL
jgi:hypothetical protein